jgi:hypothetical protein
MILLGMISTKGEQFLKVKKLKGKLPELTLNFNKLFKQNLKITVLTALE